MTLLAKYPEGLRITLSAIKNLTVDANGAAILTTPLVFQCPPQEEFAFTRQFTTGNYDTITGTSYTRRGSRQLAVWQFDTLAMYLGYDSSQTYYTPSWVPFPQAVSGSTAQPDWYAQQIAAVHDSGAPFWFSAGYTSDTRPLLHLQTNLLQYNEGYKTGEDDTIYFEQMSFSEWRNPNIPQAGLGTAKGTTGTQSVTLWLVPTSPTGTAGTCITTNGKVLPAGGQRACTLADLAKYFYGEPSEWRRIAQANQLSGGGANTPISQYSRFTNALSSNYKLTIPARNAPKKQTSTMSGTLYGGFR